MDKTIKFPNDGALEGAVYKLATLAKGRNGTIEICGVHLSSWGGHVVQIQPITRARKVPMQCYIEIPKDKDTINQVIRALEAIRDEAAAAFRTGS
jgi:hypothetical protein